MFPTEQSIAFIKRTKYVFSDTEIDHAKDP